MYALVTVPDATTLISSTTAYSSGFFTELLPLVWPVVGIAIAVYVALMIRRAVIKGGRKVSRGK